MTTPENIRRMTESEALTESVQTMEYLNEFPSMGERRDFRRFPPNMGTLITIQIDWEGDQWNPIKTDQTIRETILDLQIDEISEDQKEDQLMEEVL